MTHKGYEGHEGHDSNKDHQGNKGHEGQHVQYFLNASGSGISNMAFLCHEDFEATFTFTFTFTN